MAKSAPEQAAQAVKFNPLLAGSAGMTIIAALIYLAPAVGFDVPVKVSKIANAAMTFGGMFGLKILLKPV